MDDLIWLQQWYLSQCNGDWEHRWGIDITTLDNPGWIFRVSLQGTKFQDEQLPHVKIARSEKDWMEFKIGKSEFFVAGGSNNLSEMISAFRFWVENKKLPF